MTENGLPKFERPPVVETVVGVQFESIPKLSNAHLGAFWKLLGEDWPEVKDAAPLQPVFERFADQAFALAGVHLKLTQDAAARILAWNRARGRLARG